MKPLKFLSMSILIASALLLSAASEGQNPRTNPSPVTSAKSGQSAETEKSKPDERSVAVVETAQPNAQQRARENKGQPIKILFVKDWSDYGLLYVTVLVAFIAFFQYRVATLAYLVDRPYLGQTTLLNLTTFERMTEGLALTTARITVENVGKRPAVIDEVGGELLLLPDASGGGIPIPPADWGNLKKLRPAASEKKVIPEKGTIEVLAQYQLGLLSEEDYKAVKMTYQKILVLAGMIKYRPVAGRWHRYRTTFGLRYNPPGFLGGKDFFSVGPAKYNVNT